MKGIWLLFRSPLSDFSRGDMIVIGLYLRPGYIHLYFYIDYIISVCMLVYTPGFCLIFPCGCSSCYVYS